MADALVSFVLNQLASVITGEIQLMKGVEDDINKLTKTFKAIQVVLRDADNKQFQNELVKLWLEEFKDVAYDMDDILDDWSTEILVKTQTGEIPNAPNCKKKVHSFICSLCSCFGEVGLRHDIGGRIKNIKERLDFIASEKDKYHLIGMNINEENTKRLETSSLINQSVIYGRNFEKGNIISKLLSDNGDSSSCQRFASPIIISIVGMGGLGKTTLAQLVFNINKVKKHFNKIMWVCVSDSFDMPTLAETIIKEAGGRVRNNPEWNELHNSLSESVMGKRFLLVLDDVWSEDPIKWESLELALKSGAQGSRIIVTTRNEKVAMIMNSSYIYDLNILSDYHCWSIISRIAFVDRPNRELETFSGIGMEIAKKCKGLPLAAKALGSLLRFKSNLSDWENVLKNDIWQIDEVEKDFLKPALLLSYFDLPSPLKACFTYCSIFPKDFMMEKDVLIKLWMAQGFLYSTTRREDVEMIGEEYFNILVSRSFFQDITFENGNISTCKMHDLVHDFAQSLLKNECSCTQMSNAHCNSKIRHLSLLGEHGESSFGASIYMAKNLRSLQLIRMHVSVFPNNFFSKFNFLRVLSLRSCGLKILPSEIGKLIHLRYLDLSRNGELKELPESITTLYNLQTLELPGSATVWQTHYDGSGCGLCKLPEELWRMNNLRHLNIQHCVRLLYLPQGIGKLTSLRTLNRFVLGGVTQGCKIEELKDLDNLKGKLKITGLGSVKTEKEASQARLKNKLYLRVLELVFGGIEGDMSSLVVDRMNSVLKGLRPPSKLETLLLHDYLGSRFPSWIGNNSMLSNLKMLTLFGCINCIEFPALGGLSSLEKLFIMGMSELKRIQLESYRSSDSICGGATLFPKLKKLHLQEMDNLEELGKGFEEAGGIDIMPRLVHMNIWKCPKLKSLPWKLPNLKEFVYNYSPALSQLPSLPKLKHLVIKNSSVDRLPQGLLADLKALEKLEIINLPKLICVPEEVKHLTRLQEICINGCESLWRRCLKGEGEDWSIISHIPNITIEGGRIQIKHQVTM